MGYIEDFFNFIGNFIGNMWNTDTMPYLRSLIIDGIISGVGGQHDFMYGGSLSEGGKTFIAIPSMTEKGVSKIKPVLTEGAGVVTTRHMIQNIVTEYGVAQLRGKSLVERARALISIAHPSVRQELDRAAAARFGHAYLRLK